MDHDGPLKFSAGVGSPFRDIFIQHGICSICQETINEQELSVNDNLKTQNNELRFQKLPFNLDQG